MKKKFLIIFELVLVLCSFIHPKSLEATSYGITETILFGLNSAAIDPKYHSTLDAIAKLLRKEYWSITLQSNANPEEKDIPTLTRQRAENVRNYLLKQGADPKRLQIGACGSSLPVADQHTEEGKVKNRYVEFVLNPDFDKMPPEEFHRLYKKP